MPVNRLSGISNPIYVRNFRAEHYGRPVILRAVVVVRPVRWFGNTSNNNKHRTKPTPNKGRLRHPRYSPRPEGLGLPHNLIKLV